MNPQDIQWIQSVFKEKKLFSELNEHQLGALIDHMDRVNFAAGDTLVEQGEEGEWFFIVRSGRIRVSRKKWLFMEKELNVLGPKDFFGELALLSGGGRSATLTALEDTVCFVMYKNQFRELVRTCPGFHREIERLVNERQASAC